MSFNAENLRAKLAGANETQDGIAGVAQYVLFHKRHAGAAAKVWAQSLSDAPVSQKLALIYVLNEVVQQAKIRKKDEFVTAFAEVVGTALPKAYAEVVPATQKRISRVVGVWRDRSVFSSQVLAQVEAGLSSSKPVAEPSSHLAAADGFFSTAAANATGPQSKPVDLKFAPEPIKTFFGRWAQLESHKSKYESLITPLVSGPTFEPSTAQSRDLAECLKMFSDGLVSLQESVTYLQKMSAQGAVQDDLVSPEFEPLTPEQHSDTELALVDELGSDVEEEPEEEYVPGGSAAAAAPGSPDEDVYVPSSSYAISQPQARAAEEEEEEEEYVPQASKKQKLGLSNDVADFLANLTKK